MRPKMLRFVTPFFKSEIRSTVSFLSVLLITGGTPLVTVAQSPTNGTVTSGSATIAQAGNTTNINQSTQAASINWQSFSIGANATVNFNQPNATAVTLNRVVGTESSVIRGVLNANGNVFLLNGNGVLVGKGASVNTGGFLASTLDISDQDFQAGKFSFHSTGSSASVINMGTITAKDGGYVALLGNQVSNQGVIVANKGSVVLAAGDAVTLNFNGNSLVGVTVDEGTLNAMVENKQAIYADGGKVILTAKSADDLLSALVNNSGLIEARTVDDIKGSILLLADGGTVHVAGALDATAPISGDGGSIETSGQKVAVSDDALVSTVAANGSTGTWLIDPDGFTIASSGGDISGATLSKMLGSTNVTLSSTDGGGASGNLDVNDSVSWAANTSLALKATNNININQAITATGATAALNLTATHGDININNAVQLSGTNAALAMNYAGDYNILTPASYAGAVLNSNGVAVANSDTSGGVYGGVTLSGANAGLKINGANYTLLHSMSQLDALDGYNAATGTGTATTVSGYYALAQNLDAGGTTYANSPLQTFNGTLAGLGHTINNLTINAPTVQHVGLVGNTSTATLRDLGLTNVNITGGSDVGALLGYGWITGTNGFTAKDVYSTGRVSQVGESLNDLQGSVGGLIGELWGKSKTAQISYAYSTADVTSAIAPVYTYDSTGAVTNISEENTFSGGLVGKAYYTYINHSDATGNVTAVAGDTGGLAGRLYGVSSSSPLLTMSYATGNATTTATTKLGGESSTTGGLIGAGGFGAITNAFATGDVNGYARVGGLIGQMYIGSVSNSYATGDVTSYGYYVTSNNGAGSTDTGGLIGMDYYADVTNSFATGNVTTTYVEPAGATGGYYTNVGGLIGDSTGATISYSYATGNVTGSTDAAATGVGGLVGYLESGLLTNSYSTSNVSGTADVGGLVGVLFNWDAYAGKNTATVSNSQAYGSVNGVRNVGGVVGEVRSTSYSPSPGNLVTYTGIVNGVSSYGNINGLGSYVGGIVGYGDLVQITDSNAYGKVEGLDNVGGLAGKAGGYSGSSAYGRVNNDRINFSAATAAAATMSSQTGNYTFGEAQEDALATPHESNAAQLEQNLVFNDLSNYSATVKTVIIDGVEYHIYDDSTKPDASTHQK